MLSIFIGLRSSQEAIFNLQETTAGAQNSIFGVEELALQPHDPVGEDKEELFLDFGLPFLIGAATAIAFMVTNHHLVHEWTIEVLEYWRLISLRNKWSLHDSHFDHTSIPPLIEDDGDDRTTELASRGTTNTSNVSLASRDAENGSSDGGTWQNSSRYTSRDDSIVKNPIN